MYNCILYSCFSISLPAHVQPHRKPPGEASKTAGIAALTRLESIEKQETIVKPTLRMDMKSSPTSSSSASKITSDQVHVLSSYMYMYMYVS